MPRFTIKNLFYSFQQWLCIAVFKMNGLEKYSKIQSSVPWVVILSGDDIFLKISWREKSIDHELKNMELICEFDPLRIFILPFRHKKKLWYSVIETPKIYPITDDAELFKVAEIILEKFQSCAVIKTNNNIEDFQQIICGLNVIREISGLGKMLICANQMNDLIRKEPFYIGPAHGDFHPKNILKDSNRNLYIIDLDCYRQQGIQAIDPIYLINEYYANKNKISWYEQLILFAENKQDILADEMFFLNKFCNTFNRQWLLMYFLDRLGQDRSYVVTTAEMPAREITKSLDVCLKNLAPCCNK